MSQIAFTKASKKQARARVAFEGPSGAGKTYTALITARALGERIAVIDTEHGSASKYADEFDFDTIRLDRYDPQMLIECLAVAASAGYDVAVVDSLSHFWMGTDGMLEQVDRAAKRSGGGNTFAGWKEVRPTERKMIEAMLAFPGHVIVTMRQKTEWVIEENDRGRKVPRKIGLKAEQREGLEYEFDIVGDLSIENELIVSKSRCKALSGAVIKKPGEEFGKQILAWLEDGVASGPTANELRDEILANPYATRDDLLGYYKRAEKLALLGAPIVDDSGDATTLGEFIAAKGKAAASRPAVPPSDTGEPLATGDQRTRLHTMLGEAGIKDRDDKLGFINALMTPERQVTSTKDLTRSEIQLVFKAIETGRAEDKVGAR